MLPKSSKYPFLYTTTKLGKQRIWACWLDPENEPIVWRTDGEVGGKLKEPSSRIFKENTIRSALEQAEEGACKMWIQKLDKGYAPDPDDKVGQEIYKRVMKQKEANGGMNRGVTMWGETKITTSTTAGPKKISERHFAMLAKKYKDYIKQKGIEEVYDLTPVGRKITFPCFVQTKVDGLRALPKINGEYVTLESRNGKNYVFLDHIREEIKRWLTHQGFPDLVLDGEMYIHHRLHPSGKEYKSVERFQFLSEACKITRKNPHPQESLVQFWVFDIWDPTKTFRERWTFLENLFKGYDGDILHLVPTYEVHNHEEIEVKMRSFVGETTGRERYEYEGLMVRQAEATYVARNNYHCSDLLKYKRFEDEEWEIYDAEPCAGNQEGAIKWKLKKEIDGRTREVVAKQMGDLGESRRLMKDYRSRPSYYNGKLINIRFNERSKDHVPRFPRATVIPEDKF